MKKTTMNLLAAIILPLLLLASACSTESRFEELLNPDGPDKQTERREVVLTLNNKLSIQKAGAPRAAATTGDASAATASVAADFKSAETNAETNAADLKSAENTAAARAAIATAEENAVATLDVYVFGAAEENGDYTFQQRFSYRSDEVADASPIPANAEELLLTGNPDADQNVTTGLLSLKRGLFVKIYCVANNTTLINPATGNPMEDNEFTPIKFNDAATAAAGNPIATAGVPTEKDFIKLHTTLLKANQPADTEGEVLLTPLSMSGAMTTPLDLTDNAATARLQTRLRLTRLAARFDIINDAAKSKFTIQSISMGNARRGTSYFPIAVKGDTPAKADEIITSAPRTFSSVTPAGGAAAPTDVPNANQGLSEGAFYTYPSPTDDKGYLILKGFYQVNKTEQKEVTYQVPFTQDSGNGAQTWLEINNNHRYTLAITDADDFHLDFTLDVADWEDDGNMDDYEPENKTGEIKIEIPVAFKDKTTDTYDPDRKIHTVTMSLKPGSTFDAKMESNSPLTVTKTYAGGAMAQQNDWLEISAPVVTAAPSTYTYTFKPKAGYALGAYPRATVRMFDGLSGNETILYVDAVIGEGIMTMEASFSGFDKMKGNDISLYLPTDGSNKGMEVKVISAGGGILTGNDESIMTVSKSPTVRSTGNITQNETEAYYILTPVATGTTTLTLTNATDPSMTDTYTVSVSSPRIILSEYDVELSVNNDIIDNWQTEELVTYKTQIPGYAKIDWEGGSPWFSIHERRIENYNNAIQIYQHLTNTGENIKKCTIKIINNLDGREEAKLTVTPVFDKFMVSWIYPFYRLADGGFTTQTLKVCSSPTPGITDWEVTSSDPATISVARNGDGTFRVTPLTEGTADITISSPSHPELTKKQTVPASIFGYWTYYGLDIANADCGLIEQPRIIWTDNMTEAFCEAQFGPGWHVPSKDEWIALAGGGTRISEEVRNNYLNNNVFLDDYYWSGSNDEADAYKAYLMVTLYEIQTTYKRDFNWIRCVRTAVAP